MLPWPGLPMLASSRSVVGVRPGICRVLLIAPDHQLRRTLQRELVDRGWECAGASTLAAAALEQAERPCPVAICDLDEADLDAILTELTPAAGLRPLVIGLVGDRERRRDAVDGGAFDCLVKPPDAVELDLALRRARNVAEQLSERGDLAPTPGIAKSIPLLEAVEAVPAPAPARPAAPIVAGSAMSRLIGASPPMRELASMIDRLARHKATALITGESGTGKELVARAMHERGPRRDKPFVAINCAAIPPALLESELFGHRRGAFTDAVRDKPGLFEEATGGSLFLDEIGELPLGLQVKLLRAIQEEEIRRIGDNESIKIDVRLMAATLRDLGEEVRAGRFREDLYYRLNVLQLHLPPLRDRRDDIPVLIDHFVRVNRRKHPTLTAEGLTDEALALLMAYHWPGNVRELENTIEQAMVLCEAPRIDARFFLAKVSRIGNGIGELRAPSGSPAGAAGTSPSAGEELRGVGLSIKKATRALEADLIRRALEQTGGNRTGAAKLLEISHRALLYKIKEYGIP
jgi:two-component system, NtrC family, response regulator AtoC